MLLDDRHTHALPCPVDLPSTIQLAIYRLGARVGVCAQLTPRARQLMAELVRCVDYKKPDESVRVRNATLATAMDVSEKTVCKLKAYLVDKGWITRHQVKSKLRGMQVSDIWLSKLALEALGLGKAVGRSGRGYPQPKAMRRTSGADACLFPQPSSKGHQAMPGISKEEQESGTPLSPSEMEHLRYLQAVYGEDLEGMADIDHEPEDQQKKALEEGRVPTDVAMLVRLGLTASAVFKLMGMAGRAGCRLGHVVAVAGAAIAKARSVFCYVRKLLGSKKDWASLASKVQDGGELRAQDPGGQSKVGTGGDPVLTAGEAAELGAPAHQLLEGGRCLVDKDRGKVWRLHDGLLESADIRGFHLLAGLGRSPAPAAARWLFTKWRSSSSGREQYELQARKLDHAFRVGEVEQCTMAEALEISVAMGKEVEVLKATAKPGLVVLSRRSGTVWRYHLGRLEQASGRPVKHQKGWVFQWAIQLSKDVEERVARGLAAGRHEVMEEGAAAEVLVAEIGASRAVDVCSANLQRMDVARGASAKRSDAGLLASMAELLSTAAVGKRGA